MLTVPQDGAKTVQIDGRGRIYSIVFEEDDKHIITGGIKRGIHEWNVEDGSEVGDHQIETINSVMVIALSRDRKWMVTGGFGVANVWDRTTREQVVSVQHEDWVDTVDVSPDSSRFATGSRDKAVCIWDIKTGQRLIGPLLHDGIVVALRFSPSGDRLATAMLSSSLRIYDARTGTVIFEVPAQFQGTQTTPLAWSRDGQTIFANCFETINCIDTSTGSILFRWESHGDDYASIALANSEKFIVSSAGHSISFWDTSKHSQIGSLINHDSDVSSIALSHDDCYLASGEDSGKITIRTLQDFLPESFCTVNLPYLHISYVAFNFWAHDDLTSAEGELTNSVTQSSARTLAQRALIRARSHDYDAAYRGAEESIRIQPLVEGHIAKSIALIGKGENELALRTFDLAFDECDRSDVKFLLLLKSILSFLAGNHDDALARVQDLVDKVDEKSMYRTIQAQMHVLLGEMYTKQDDFEHAIKAFKRAQSFAPFPKSPYLTTISLIFGWNMDRLGITIQLHLFKALHAAGRTADLSQLPVTMDDISHEQAQTQKSTMEWEVDFNQKCVATFENNGDAEVGSGNHEEAIAQYSTALSLSPQNPFGLLVKRSKARAALKLWGEVLEDANEAIIIDVSSPWGYEQKHAALHGMERYDEAIGAFSRMLFALENSSDEVVRQSRKNHVTHQETIAAIDATINDIVKLCPLVLIDVTTGRLCDVAERIRVFKSETAFKGLVSSMTAGLDYSRIQQSIARYFQYFTLSHVWQGKEPTFQDVNLVKSIWKLEPSLQTSKLHRFCELVRDDGGRFVWSDTCCIDKTIGTTLNQSLTSMYVWYKNSASTIVYLADVNSPSMPGDLEKSRWMTRAWTSQEGLAPKSIRFYDREWKPYLNDTSVNHKESPVIMQEFANATRLTRENIIAFRPGDLSVREKLRLVSTRNATVEEDIAYSLIGIFESDITPRYGEGGEVALGHLLEEIVTRLGEVTVLAWVGKSSGYNSSLPASLTVYSQTPHTPSSIDDNDMESRVAELRATLPQHEAMMIYDRVTRLPSARFANRRLYLPCIVFPVQKLISHVGNVYRIGVSVLGDVAITTTESLSLADPRRFILVHPWIRDVLDRTHPLDGLPFGQDEFDFLQSSSPQNSAPSTSVDSYTQALRLAVRLGRPFNALLLERQSYREFRRVAAEQGIIVQANIGSARDVPTAVLEIL